jgi:hypothetical protein
MPMKPMHNIDHDRLVELYLTGWWRKTRAAVVHRFLHCSDRLIELIRGVDVVDEELGGRVDSEIEHIITRAIGQPWSTTMTARQHAIWDAARAACPDRRILMQMITSDRAVRGLSRIPPKHALGRLLKSHLDSCHWEVLGLTEHRARVWSKLRRISTELLREYQAQHGHDPPPGYRCSRQHFRDIRTRILRDDLHDARIAEIKVDTIEEYFGRLCEECRQMVPLDEELFDEEQGPIDDGELRPRLVSLLKRCIEQLEEPLQRVIRIAYLGDKSLSWPPAQDTGPEAGRTEFERLRHEALRQLRSRLDTFRRDTDEEQVRNRKTLE